MKPYFEDEQVTLWQGDSLAVLRELPDSSVNCCVTSPPYFGLRDYGQDGQYGLESSPGEFVATMRDVFAEVRRVLTNDGTLWLNLGDSYSGSWGGQGVTAKSAGKHGPVVAAGAAGHRTSHTGSIKPGAPPAKNLLGIPWRTAFALQDDGWILRNDIIWAKPNGMPESVTDRMTTKHEHVFLFSKSRRYWFDLDPIRVGYDGDRDLARRARTGEANKSNSVRTSWPPVGGTTKREGRKSTRYGGTTYPEGISDQTNGSTQMDAPEGGRNPGDVWLLPTQPFPAAHFAVMPPALAERCVSAGCKPGGTVLDPFSGSGTTGLAAARHGRRYVGIDLSSEYLDLSLRTRLAQTTIVDGGDVA